MKNKYEVNYRNLKMSCSPNMFNFETTENLESLPTGIGQDRGIKALEFGLNVDVKGYNLYIEGPGGVGKTMYTRNYLNKISKKKKAPHDWCYIYNFQNPNEPIAVDLPAGQGKEFKDSMEGFIKEIKKVREKGTGKYPVVIVTTPKGWTGPKEVNDKKVEGSFRAHQVPVDMSKEEHLGLLENWLRSYKPEELFTEEEYKNESKIIENQIDIFSFEASLPKQEEIIKAEEKMLEPDENLTFYVSAEGANIKITITNTKDEAVACSEAFVSKYSYNNTNERMYKGSYRQRIFSSFRFCKSI